MRKMEHPSGANVMNVTVRYANRVFSPPSHRLIEAGAGAQVQGGANHFSFEGRCRICRVQGLVALSILDSLDVASNPW